MRTVRDVIATLDTRQTGLSSYGALAPVYDFINADHFDYERQERIALDHHEEGLLVELGCGSGRLLSRIDGAVDSALGVDMSPVMLRRAAERTDASLVQADVRTPVLQTSDVGSAVMLGRVFSKLRTDADVRQFAEATASWTTADTTLVFNTFRRSDLVDGMRKTQSWERNGIRIVRDSETTLKSHVRNGLFEIRMKYEMTDTRQATRANGYRPPRRCSKTCFPRRYRHHA